MLMLQCATQYQLPKLCMWSHPFYPPRILKASINHSDCVVPAVYHAFVDGRYIPVAVALNCIDHHQIEWQSG